MNKKYLIPLFAIFLTPNITNNSQQDSSSVNNEENTNFSAPADTNPQLEIEPDNTFLWVILILDLTIFLSVLAYFLLNKPKNIDNESTKKVF